MIAFPAPPASLAEPTVRRSECFPIERLRPTLRARAEAALLKALDGEALYTIVGAIKPMSSGWMSLRSDVANPDVAAIRESEEIASVMRCGTVRASVQPFHRAYEGKRYIDAVFVHEPTFRAVVDRNASLFGSWGVTGASEPTKVLMAFDRDETAERNRAYGLLFGYPEYAIDFFVRATEEGAKTGTLVPRDFVSMPTFSGENRFVYAVPKGGAIVAVDDALRARCAPIQAKYRELRARYIRPGGKGAFALVRDWMGNGRSGYSPAIALTKCGPMAAREPYGGGVSYGR